MPSEQYNRIIELLKSTKVDRTATVEERRKNLEKMASLVRLPSDIRFEPLKVGNIPAEWIFTPVSVEDRIILYLHGGGYAIGSIKTHREMASRIARASEARGLIIEYRLAPEHKFPAAVEDSTLAYRWLLKEGYNPDRIVIAGDSAGGGLTVATLVALRDQGEPLPAAAVCLSPWIDLEGLGESVKTKADIDPLFDMDGIIQNAKLYLGDEDPHNPLAAPLYADLKGLPPMLIQVGTWEILLDDSVRLAERAKKAGVEVILEKWEDMVHVFQSFGYYLPEAQEAVEHIGDFVIQYTS
ncbi:MAG: alpha/beta hydrolase [Candidatus Helarchaeota archaeon]|nr:alpha/beta hydrolase [Candidatus Helarchaeota archaeon]